MLRHPHCANFAVSRFLWIMVCTFSLLIDSLTAISSIVIRQIYSISSFAAEILVLLIITYTCPKNLLSPAQCEVSPSCLSVRRHNADTTWIWCNMRGTALHTPLLSYVKFERHVLPRMFCVKKLNNCPLCWCGGIHRATNCGNSPEMTISLRNHQMLMNNGEYHISRCHLSAYTIEVCASPGLVAGRAGPGNERWFFQVAGK